jgi:glyoxylase-like metal-dependent hydrolase (beta-lactamase superfamily II)
MCNQCEQHSHHHSHGQFDRARLGRFRPIGRRTFLASMGKGTFALLTEASIGRGVIAIALGTTATGLAACTAPPAAPATPAVTAVPTVEPTAESTAEPTAAPTVAAATESPAATTASAATGTTLPPVDYQLVNLGFVNAYVLVRGNEVAVVDTGVANSQGKIEEVIKAAGRSWDDVRHVILTHHHPDHAGSMNEVMSAAVKATAYAGLMDIPSIHTTRTIQPVGDGSEVFGLQIIATPGHTPGHISVYDPNIAFIAGDALNNGDGNLTGPNPQYSADMTTANQSVQKIGNLSFERAFFGHGVPIETGASAAIAALAATLK